MLVVTHLLGAGHLTRAAAIARAFARAGHETTLVSGGMPAPLVSTEGVRLVQLPPVHIAGTDFKNLLDAAGAPATPAYLEARAEALLGAFAEARPDVLVTELFPFGRRALSDEFEQLLAAAHVRAPRPLIACSIRDVLVRPSKEKRIAQAHERIARWYDLVLVHGDPDLVPLEASWPVDAAIAGKLRYTGYVDDGAEARPTGERSGIVVSGGSSSAGLALYTAAVEAARGLPHKSWRILVGNGVAENAFAALSHQAPANARVERARADFRDLLRASEVSVSQCGYNTAVDVLRTGVEPVFVPFEAGNETEQRLRAEALAARGIGRVLPEAELSAETLAQSIEAGLARSLPKLDLDLSGASRTVDILAEAAGGRGASSPTPLEEALARLRDSGRELRFWWRDDDAVAVTSALERLLALSRASGIPIGIAAIPRRMERSLPERLSDEPGSAILVHGFEHENNAPVDVKKGEFTHGALDTLIEKVTKGLELSAPAGPLLLPVFVPPWNRIAPELLPYLPRLGYRGLSTYADRRAQEAAPALLQVNTHVDPIDWRGGGGALTREAVEAQLARAIEVRLAGTADPDEPIGLLTHHLVHDEAVWRLLESLIERLSRATNLRYVSAAEAFSLPEAAAQAGTAIR